MPEKGSALLLSWLTFLHRVSSIALVGTANSNSLSGNHQQILQHLKGKSRDHSSKGDYFLVFILSLYSSSF